ncbi:MAG: hypothetical protein CM15mP3_02560 [Candidatus Poseidoniales archaeon]|nr:MAG: hypothetical protein CM15mP3_02560 [Candidatus Poseidoniales archaeon]
MNLSRSAANMSDEPATWPDDDEDPFAPVEPTEDITDEEVIEESTTDDASVTEEVESQENPSAVTDTLTDWSLPVRVAPVLALSGEKVAEYPLNESPDGRKNTSLIVSDGLIRIIEVSYDDDGQRRLNVKAVFKNELTGFSHNHNELMHKHQWMWLTALFAGLATSFIPFFGFVGQFLIATGVIGWVYMHLEVHTLEFSTSGSKHKVAFTGYGSNRPAFRASMALIGPTIAKYMEVGEFDTDSINNLHKSLAAPAPQVPPVVIDDQSTPSLLEGSPANTLQGPPASKTEPQMDEAQPTLPPPPAPQEMPNANITTFTTSATRDAITAATNISTTATSAAGNANTPTANITTVTARPQEITLAFNSVRTSSASAITTSNIAPTLAFGLHGHATSSGWF